MLLKGVKALARGNTYKVFSLALTNSCLALVSNSCVSSWCWPWTSCLALVSALNYVPLIALKAPKWWNVTDHMIESAYLYIAHTEVVISVYAAMIAKCMCLIFFWNFLLQNVPCLCLDDSKPCLTFLVFFKLRLPLKFWKVFIVLWYLCIICVCHMHSVCLSVNWI